MLRVQVVDEVLIDWYDGVLQAFVRTDAPFEFGLVDAVGVDPDDFDRRIYALTPVTADVYGPRLDEAMRPFGPRTDLWFHGVILNDTQRAWVDRHYGALLASIGMPTYLFRPDDSVIPPIIELLDASGVAFPADVHHVDMAEADLSDDYPRWVREWERLAALEQD